jgi:hypothetical protein
MSYPQAIAKLPPNAYISCTFGYPGVGGYSEYYRDPEGRRYIVANGRYDGDGKVWTFEEVR